jgi:hypothetical protein
MKTEGKKLTIKEGPGFQNQRAKMMFLMEKREKEQNQNQPIAKERVAERVKLSDAKIDANSEIKAK